MDPQPSEPALQSDKTAKPGRPRINPASNIASRSRSFLSSLRGCIAPATESQSAAMIELPCDPEPPKLVITASDEPRTNSDQYVADVIVEDKQSDQSLPAPAPPPIPSHKLSCDFSSNDSQPSVSVASTSSSFIQGGVAVAGGGRKDAPSATVTNNCTGGRAFLSTSIALANYTFLFNACLHALTFGLNALAFRRIDITYLGLVNVRLGLFYSTLVFLSREAFRKACLSRGGELSSVPFLISQHQPSPQSSGRKQWRAFFSTAWLVLPLGLFFASILLPTWLYLLPSPGTQSLLVWGESKAALLQTRYTQCLLVYTVSAMLELATEPFWLLFQLSHLVGRRVWFEMTANLARVLGILICLFTLSPDLAIYSLALPQILHGSTLLVLYLIYTWNRFKPSSSTGDYQPPFSGLTCVVTFSDILPRWGQSSSIDKSVMKVVKSLIGQKVLKQFLTEGERYLITSLNLISFKEQAVYDFVANIGSLAARLLFAPLEESCHFIFGQCICRDTAPEKQDQIRISQALRMLRIALRLSSIAGWIGLTFAQANSRLLLLLYAGPEVASNHITISLLRLYSAYVLLLAWNGSTEAFLHAAMSAAEISRHNRRIILYTILYLLANVLLVPTFGIYGFVLANCVNMMARISYSYYFISTFLLDLFRTTASMLDTPAQPATATNCKITADANAASAAAKQLASDINLMKMGVALSPSSGSPSSSSNTSSVINKNLRMDWLRSIHRKTFLAKLMLPTKSQAVLLIASLTTTLYSEANYCCDKGWYSIAIHASVTLIALLLVAVVVWLQDSEVVRALFTSKTSTTVGTGKKEKSE